MASNSSSRARDGLDRIGTVVAAVCALHCALMPLAWTMIPSLTLALLSWHDPHHRAAILLLQASRWEGGLVAIALGFAGISLGLGYVRHRGWRPSFLLITAAPLFIAAIASPLAADPALHAGLAVLGGVTLAAAHLSNLRLLRGAREAHAVALVDRP